MLWWFSHSVVSDYCDPMDSSFPEPMGFSRQEYWSELPFPSPGDLPNPGIKPGSHVLQADSLPIELLGIDIQYTSVHSIQFNQY